MADWFSDNAPQQEAAPPDQGGDWFAQHAPVETAQEPKPESSLHKLLFGREAAQGLREGIQSLVPQSVGAAAKMAFYTPVEDSPRAIKEAYDVIRGVPTAQAVPESQTLVGYMDKPLREQVKIGTELAGQIGMGVGVALGLRAPRLSETLKPILGREDISPIAATEREVIKDAKQPSNAQIQARETSQRIEARPQGEVPRTSGGDYVERETQGTTAGVVPRQGVETQPAQEKIATTKEAFPSVLQSTEDARRAELAKPPEIPEGAKATVRFRTDTGEHVMQEMDAKEAEGIFTKERSSYRALLDCLGR